MSEVGSTSALMVEQEHIAKLDERIRSDARNIIGIAILAAIIGASFVLDVFQVSFFGPYRLEPGGLVLRLVALVIEAGTAAYYTLSHREAVAERYGTRHV